jgi:hypothetical protein
VFVFRFVCGFMEYNMGHYVGVITSQTQHEFVKNDIEFPGTKKAYRDTFVSNFDKKETDKTKREKGKIVIYKHKGYCISFVCV